MKRLVALAAGLIIAVGFSNVSEARVRHHQGWSPEYIKHRYHPDYNFQLSYIAYHSPREFNYFAYQAYNGN